MAALAAIYTAHYLGLTPPTAAGLLAVLGVEVTRMKGLRSVAARFAASVVGLLVASAIFIACGFHIWALALFVLIAFPVMNRLQLKDGIITGVVVVFHVFVREQVNAGIIGNEIMLLITGLGWATVINLLYMPGEERGLEALKRKLEGLFRDIFEAFARSLRDPSHPWDGAELLEAGRSVKEGLRLADLNRENRMWRHEAYWRTYFAMRRRQLETIEQMLDDLAFVYDRVPQGELIAEVFERLAVDVASDVYEGAAERKLGELDGVFRAMPLPATRDEFEIRATLLQLRRELQRYLDVAKRLKRKRTEGRGAGSAP